MSRECMRRHRVIALPRAYAESESDHQPKSAVTLNMCKIQRRLAELIVPTNLVASVRSFHVRIGQGIAIKGKYADQVPLERNFWVTF